MAYSWRRSSWFVDRYVASVGAGAVVSATARDEGADRCLTGPRRGG